MKYLLKLNFLFFLGTINLLAQAPDTAWTKVYGGNDLDEAHSVQQTSDGGYIVAGYTASYGAGEDDVYLIKTDSLGDTLWTRTYGGTASDGGNSVCQTSDGGYIVAGYTASYGAGGVDVYLIRTDDSGDTLWTKVYGGDKNDYGQSVQQTPDEGYIVAGYTASYGAGGGDVYLIKTDSVGDTLWTRTYGGTASDGGYSVRRASSGYIVAGYTASYGTGEDDVYLFRTNSVGDTLWTRTYGGAYDDVGCSIDRDRSSGRFIVGGGFMDYGYAYLINSNGWGDTLWTRTYDIGGSGYYAGSVQWTIDGGYIFAGYRSYFPVGDRWSPDIYLIKTDSLGDILWTRKYVGIYGYSDRSLQQTRDGGYIFAGYTFFLDILTITADVYLMKIKPEGSGIEEDIITDLFSLSPANPNPFTTETTVNYSLPKETNISIFVYNILGQKVRDLYSGKQSSGFHSVSWDGSGNSGEKVFSGIYFLKIEAGDRESSTKVTFVR